MTKKWIFVILISTLIIFSMTGQVIAEEEEDGEEGEIEVIDAIVIFTMSIALIILFTTLIKRKDLIKYFLGFVTIWFAYLFQSLEEATSNEIFCLLISISVLIAGTIFSIGVFIDYYKIVLNKKQLRIKNFIKRE